MSRWFCEDPERTEISLEEKQIRDRLIAIMSRYTREMENYGYFGSNPGIPEGEYDEVAEDIMKEFGLNAGTKDTDIR